MISFFSEIAQNFSVNRITSKPYCYHSEKCAFSYILWYSMYYCCNCKVGYFLNRALSFVCVDSEAGRYIGKPSHPPPMPTPEHFNLGIKILGHIKSNKCNLMLLLFLALCLPRYPLRILELRFEKRSSCRNKAWKERSKITWFQLFFLENTTGLLTKV